MATEGGHPFEESSLIFLQSSQYLAPLRNCMDAAEAIFGGLFILGFGYGLWSLISSKPNTRIEKVSSQSETYSSRAVDAVVQMYEETDFEPVQVVDDSHMDKLEELRTNVRKEWSKEERQEHERIQKERLKQYAEMAMGLPGQFDHILKDEPKKKKEFKREAEEARLQLLQERDAWVSEFEPTFDSHAKDSGLAPIQGVLVKMKSNSREEDFQKRLEREGGETGFIQVSLIWDNHNDLDLHVITPGDERVSFNKRRTDCGGTLDVDMNARPTSKEAIENLVWWKQPPAGKYVILVHHYAKHRRWRTNDPTFFQVRVKFGHQVDEYMGSISHGEPVFKVCEIEIESEEESD